MSYRNKTYVAFASEDIRDYWMMQAWRDNANIDFDFFDAHDINTARDSSEPATIRRRLGERLANTKQAIVLLSDITSAKAANSESFLYYEIETIARLGLPVVFVNLNQSRSIQTQKIPGKLQDPYYTISVSYQPKIIQHALNDYVPEFNENLTKEGPHRYKEFVYENLGL